MPASVLRLDVAEVDVLAGLDRELLHDRGEAHHPLLDVQRVAAAAGDLFDDEAALGVRATFRRHGPRPRREEGHEAALPERPPATANHPPPSPPPGPTLPGRALITPPAERPNL